MKVFACISFLTLLAIPVLLTPGLFAQTTSGGESSYESVTADFEVINQSEEGAGEFVGAGVPEYFIGTEDVSRDLSSGASRLAENSAQRRTTSTRTTRRATTTASRRRTGTTLGTGRAGNLNNNQSIQSVSSFDRGTPSFREPLQTKIASHLNQIRNIQGGQVTLSDSPSGTTAVLSGTVTSERERQVASLILLLEPGIDQVENLLEVR